jgi:hypothetical protein
VTVDATVRAVADRLDAGDPPRDMSSLVGGRIANSSGIFFWVRTMMALGVTSVFSVVLSAQGLWHAWRRPR